jgi:CDP-glucose 4,6-dehydratase
MRGASIDSNFWRNKKVFVTGHTGFKGSWLTVWLCSLGARVTGYALPPPTNPNMFYAAHIERHLFRSELGDVTDFNKLKSCLLVAQPDIIIHMAAQPLVRQSYMTPIDTFETNVMGTVNLLEAARNTPTVKSIVVITTDKCYENNDRTHGYVESDPMGGYDPYSGSKGCAELVVATYRRSYFSSAQSRCAIASARAGNVIGGGDWASDRLIPDALRAFESQTPIVIRNPHAVRPWQHVVEPLAGYLILAQRLFEQGSFYGQAWNFGPEERETVSVQAVVEMLIQKWFEPTAGWVSDGSQQVHEANYIKLDCSKAKAQLNWVPKWSLEQSIDRIIAWQSAYIQQKDMYAMTLSQIIAYQNS